MAEWAYTSRVELEDPISTFYYNPATGRRRRLPTRGIIKYAELCPVVQLAASNLDVPKWHFSCKSLRSRKATQDSMLGVPKTTTALAGGWAPQSRAMGAHYDMSSSLPYRGSLAREPLLSREDVVAMMPLKSRQWVADRKALRREGQLPEEAAL